MPLQQAPDQWVEVTTIGVKHDFGDEVVQSWSTPPAPDAPRVPDDPDGDDRG